MAAWLEHGLHNALFATALAAGVCLITRYWRRPQVAGLLWAVVLLRLLAPPVWQFSLPSVPPGAVEPADETEIVQAFDELTAAANVHSSPPAMRQSSSAPKAEAAQQAPDRRELAEPLAEPPATLASNSNAAAAPLPAGRRLPVPWAEVVLVVWIAGSLAYFSLLASRCWRFSRLLARTPLAPPELAATVAMHAQQLGLRRTPNVRTIDRGMPPLVWAFAGRPTLLLPSQLLTTLSADERSLLILHELMHLKYRDHWIGWLRLLAVGCYWWHPVAWFASRRLERATEQCCDERVVAWRPELARAYALALLNTVEYLSDTRCAVPAGAHAFSQVPAFQRRLEMILSIPRRSRLGFRSRALLVLTGAGLLTVSLRTAAAEPSVAAKSSASALEQRLERLEKMVEALTLEVRALKEAETGNAAPTVVKTVPENGAKEVDPGLTEIRVTFSKDMRDGSWSWTQRSDDSYPEVTGKPHYVDKRTCVLPVKLEPGKTYWIGLNSARFGNFKDPAGRSAVPFPLSFTTRP